MEAKVFFVEIRLWTIRQLRGQSLRHGAKLGCKRETVENLTKAEGAGQGKSLFFLNSNYSPENKDTLLVGTSEHPDEDRKEMVEKRFALSEVLGYQKPKRFPRVDFTLDLIPPLSFPIHRSSYFFSLTAYLRVLRLHIEQFPGVKVMIFKKPRDQRILL